MKRSLVLFQRIQNSQGINGGIVHVNAEIAVDAGYPSGGPHGGDDLSLAHHVALRYQHAVAVGIAGLVSVPMVDQDVQAIAGGIVSLHNDAGRCGMDLGAGLVRQIDSGVEFAPLSCDRIDTRTEIGTDITVIAEANGPNVGDVFVAVVRAGLEFLQRKGNLGIIELAAADDVKASASRGGDLLLRSCAADARRQGRDGCRCDDDEKRCRAAQKSS